MRLDIAVVRFSQNGEFAHVSIVVRDESDNMVNIIEQVCANNAWDVIKTRNVLRRQAVMLYEESK